MQLLILVLLLSQGNNTIILNTSVFNLNNFVSVHPVISSQVSVCLYSTNISSLFKPLGTCIWQIIIPNFLTVNNNRWYVFGMAYDALKSYSRLIPLDYYLFFQRTILKSEEESNLFTGSYPIHTLPSDSNRPCIQPDFLLQIYKIIFNSPNLN